MRRVIIVAVMALGLVALWAAIVPLTAEPAPARVAAGSPAMAKALFLCRGANGIDRACTAALAQALVLDAAPAKGAATRVSEHTCHIDRQTLASLEHRD
ncbi:MAG TPA: hypothetical protein VFL55_01835 [Acetobacteraceae bacterium]|nr:hypothetical protein [Acetobacteraceae bacterium]